MSGPTRDSKVEKWQGWLRTKIHNEIVVMYHRRRVYRNLGEIIERHGELPPSTVFDFIRSTYVTTQSVAVRRQADADPRVISLGRLLNEIEAEPERLTRHWYLSMSAVDDQSHAAQLWETSWFAGPHTAHVGPAAIRADLDRLADESVNVRAYVDRHLAHYDKKSLPELPTVADLHSAVETIGELGTRYAGLLLNTYWATLVPIIQYNWLAPFQEPWIKDNAVIFDIMAEDPITGQRR